MSLYQLICSHSSLVHEATVVWNPSVTTTHDSASCRILCARCGKVIIDESHYDAIARIIIDQAKGGKS